MSDDFRYQCRRRSPRSPPPAWPIADGVELLGAGSGGDGETVYGSQNVYFQGKWVTSAGKILLYAEDRTAAGTTLTQDDPFMGLIASDFGEKGRVCMRGGQGVRITSGPPKQPPASDPKTDGLEMQCGDEQTIRILRGMEENPLHGSMYFGPAGIVMHSNDGFVALKSNTKMKLEVAGGTSYILLTPSGIVMKGPLIQIN